VSVPTRVEQILVPENDTLVGFGGDRTLEEDGTVALSINQVEVAVSFLATKINSNYEFIALYVSAIGETTPAAIQVVPTIQTIYGFTVELSGSPDTGNYVLHWHVKILDEPEQPPISQPVANFNFSPSDQIIAGTTVNFTDVSTDALAPITTWAWNFGDGNTSALENPTHVFSAQGTFGVKLTVTDSNGVQNSIVKSVVILVIPPVSITARVTNSLNSSNVPTGVWTNLYFDTDRWDTDSIHDLTVNPDRLTCQHAGLYEIVANVEVSDSNVGFVAVAIVLNGIDYIGYAELLVTGTSQAEIINVTTQWQMQVGDYVQCRVYQNSGMVLQVQRNLKFSPEFMMTLIGNALIQTGPGGPVVSTTIVISGGLIGASVIPVPLTLTSPPKLQGLPWFEKANPADDNVFVESVDSLTNTGFNCNLSSPAISGQILHIAYTLA
jgi:PKD repeat protein